VPCTLDSYAQVALLTLGQTSLLTSLDLAVLVYVALQGLEILVVKVSYVCTVLKNLCHKNVEQRQTCGFYIASRKINYFGSAYKLASGLFSVAPAKWNTFCRAALFPVPLLSKSY